MVVGEKSFGVIARSSYLRVRVICLCAELKDMEVLVLVVCTSLLLGGIDQLQQHPVGRIFRRAGCHLAVFFTRSLSRETLSLRPRQLMWTPVLFLPRPFSSANVCGRQTKPPALVLQKDGATTRT